MTEVLNDTVEAIINSTKNGTSKPVSTPEGMFAAYGSLVIMAIFPIILGSLRSITFQAKQKESGDKAETMTYKDAAMFPLIASVTLFGIYIFFKVFSKQYINLLLSFYFLMFGVLALAHITTPFLKKFIPNFIPNRSYHMLLVGDAEKKDDPQEKIVDHKFDHKDMIIMALCAAFGVWYIYKKHWIANNIFGLAFSINGVEFLQLNKFATGAILLSGLFIYDIFWVFATNVMVTVAKSFDAPIKLVFPQDIFENGIYANNMAMLGLGDIVIPGILIALLARFDNSRKPGSHVYFYTGMFAYLSGLVLTIGVMHVFKHAQPALLYLVPTCLLFPIIVASIRGELKQLLKYSDNPEEEKSAIKKE